MKRSLPFFPFMKRAGILSVIFTLVCVVSFAQDCGCDFTIEPPASRATSLFISGETLGVKPGQTICLKAGFYMQIRLVGISGAPGNPVTIKNCGGLVEIGDAANFGRWYAMDVVRNNYIRYTGTGDPEHFYGIKLGKSGDTALKIGLSTDVEIDHLEIANTGFAGIMAKSDYRGNPPPDAPEMNNINIHDNYIHDTHGEGMYIGETKSPGQNLRHLEVWNNIITRTGLDFFQVANVVEDIDVHHNVFYRSGLRNVLYQNKGVQIGDNSVGRYHHNIVIGSPSNSMIVMGSGNIHITDNYFAGAGDPAFFIDNRAFTLPDEPININRNLIMEVKETVPYFQVFNEINPINITGNTLEGNNALASYGSGAGAKVAFSDNTAEAVERVQFVDAENDNFVLAQVSPHQDLGLLKDAGGRNSKPFISLIPNAQLDYETTLEIPVSAGDADGDALRLEAFNLPSFVSFHDKGNGTGIFTVAPPAGSEGIYHKLRVRVTDSEGSMNSQNFTLTVLDPYAFLASASSSLLNLGPENTLDGNLATRWAPGAEESQWIKYDLREDKLVTSVDIAFHQGALTTYPFTIEISENDLDWVEVFSGESSGETLEPETFSFEEIRARYLRISHQGSLNSYNEVVIHGVTAPVFHPFAASDDVYAEGTKVYDDNELKVKVPNRQAIMRFAVSDLVIDKSPVVSARLRITATKSGYGRLMIFLADDRDWTEGSAAHRDLPRPIQVLDTIAGNFAKDQVYELNVSGVVRGNGVYNFILVLEDSKGAGVAFSSAEGLNSPELVVETLRGAEVGDAPSTGTIYPEDGPEDESVIAREIKLFPNPVQDQLRLDLGEVKSGLIRIEIADQEGVRYFKKNWKHEGQFVDVDLSNLHLEPGYYILRLLQPREAVTTLRFLKQ